MKIKIELTFMSIILGIFGCNGKLKQTDNASTDSIENSSFLDSNDRYIWAVSLTAGSGDHSFDELCYYETEIPKSMEEASQEQRRQVAEKNMKLLNTDPIWPNSIEVDVMVAEDAPPFIMVLLNAEDVIKDDAKTP